MSIDEGEAPKGSLSKYISGVFVERARQEAEAQRQKDAETQAKLDHFILVTAPLRNHLLKLADPIEELLARFGVREFLKEAQNVHTTHQASLFKKALEDTPGLHGLPQNYAYFHKGFIESYDIEELRPQIYRDIVLNPKPTTLLELENETIDLEARSPLHIFRVKDEITRLWGYGLALCSKEDTDVRAVRREKKWQESYYTPGFSSIRSGPDWSASHSDYHEAGWTYLYCNGSAPIRVIKSFVVEVVKSELDPKGYDLMYSHQLERIDTEGWWSRFGENDPIFKHIGTDYNKYQSEEASITKPHPYPRPLDKHIYLTPPTLVHNYDPAEVLRDLIGKDLINELDGKYEDIYFRFKTKGQKKNEGWMYDETI